MTDDRTARLDLALLVPGQAQKELWHNEGLAAIDLVLQASVVAAGPNTPPATPGQGQCWIVGPAPTGDWAGMADHLAGWTQGGWRFAAPVEGMTAWVADAAAFACFHAGAWTIGIVRATRLEVGGVQVVGSRRAAITNPVAGGVIDSEARAAVGSILATLRGHGLIDP
ncbi:DUF2793 domain-containing protein [uncultured Sphingomonas sp.]|uniref:DUF2793 domain-containing protein n=1 Tax=uncultured Sphingomonas sp. TaxID=158754 RepID=UPI0035C9FBAE